MGIFRKIVSFPLRILDLRVDRWLDLKRHAANTAYLMGQARSIFNVQHPSRIETYEQAIVRLGLNEEDLNLQRQRFLILSLCFLFFALLLGVYLIYLVFKTYWMGTIMTLALMLYALSQSFRYHFWYFQMKKRKLGCSLYEWLRSLGHS